MNICDAKEVPYINTFLDEDAASKSTVLNIHPHLESLTQLLLDYMEASGWKAANILYESPLWLRRIARILENNNRMKNRIDIYNLDYTKNNEFRPTLQEVRDSSITNIILDCSTESLPIILRQSMEVGLMTKHHRWIITNLDAHAADLEPYRYSGVNITVFRILNRNHPIFSRHKLDDNDDDAFNVDPESQQSSLTGNCDGNNNLQFPIYPEKFYGKSFCEIKLPLKKKHTLFLDAVSLRTSLIYDSVMVFATAVEQLGREQVLPTKIWCQDTSSTWNKGYTILNFMKNVSKLAAYL